MNMDDLMKALNQSGGAPGSGEGQASNQPDLGSLLGMLGGGEGQGGQPDLGNLLGALLGGGR